MKRFAALVFALLSFCYLSEANAQFNKTQPGCAVEGFCSNSGLIAAPVSNACITSSGTTITFTAQGTGGPNPNRISVVSINWSDSTAAGTAQLNSMTIGGISMTRAVRTTSGVSNSNSEIWYVANPTGSASNVVAVFATAVNGVTIEVYSLIGYRLVAGTNTGTTTVSQGYSNKQLGIAAGSRTVNVSTSLSNMTNDFSSACGSSLWGVHASQKLNGNNGTLTTAINPTSNNPKIALAIWSTTLPTPLLSNTIGWWDMSVVSGTTLNGSNQILSVQDQSGGNNTMFSAVANPPYNATGFNGRPTIAFDQTTSTAGLVATAFPLGTGNTLTIWMVATGPSTTVASGGRWLSYWDQTGNDFDQAGAFTFSIAGTTQTAINITRHSVNVGQTITIYPALHVFITTIDSSGVMTIYTDGVASSTGTAAGNWVSGGFLCIGKRCDQNSGYWSGNISEVGISTNFTNSSGVATLNSALHTKWGF